MSLNAATTGITGALGQKNPVSSVTQGNLDVPSTVKKQQKTINSATEDVTDKVLPGQYPDDANGSPPASGSGSGSSFFASFISWIKQLLGAAMDMFESSISSLVCWLFPPPRQIAMYEAMLARPYASTFLVCQLICCGIPLLVFVAGVFVFAAVAVLLWALLSVLILGPFLLVASMMGVSLWGCGWVAYGLGKWIDQKFLGGMITRFWLSHAPAVDEQESQPQEKDTQSEKEEEEGDDGDDDSDSDQQSDT